jgi:hypothetical protein
MKKVTEENISKGWRKTGARLSLCNTKVQKEENQVDDVQDGTECGRRSKGRNSDRKRKKIRIKSYVLNISSIGQH